MIDLVNKLKNDSMQQLTQTILPFWNKMRDNEFGGFYGAVNNDLVINKKADKGLILTSRILWFYSSVYKTIGGDENLSNARHAFEFIKNKCIDTENGGVYWMMTYDGKVSDGMKHTYNQAFAVYAISAYYLISEDKDALELAIKIFETIEEKCTDDVAYMEAFSMNWELIPNDALSENGLMADKTMNTVLHLIEAYTVLFEAAKDNRVAKRLRFLLDISKDKIFDSENNKLFVFFDHEFNVIGDIHSYGHDIEATWLIDRACKILDEKSYSGLWKEINLHIAQNIYNLAFENSAVNNERENEKIDKKRVWWVQAESIVGFINAYEHSGDMKYLEAADMIMEYIKNYQVDKRQNSEWWGEVDFDGKPMLTVDMAGPWKCPYHNGRMCIEVLNRKIT